MSDHDTCGACRWSTAIHDDGRRRDDIVECDVSGRIVCSGETGCSAWDDYRALEAEVEYLRAQRDALLEAINQSLDWIADPIRPMDFEAYTAKDILERAIRGCRRVAQEDGRMSTLRWTPSGNIDIDAMTRVDVAALGHRESLRRMLYEVWADAYAHGWSDGVNHRDANERENPYRSGPDGTLTEE